MTVHILNEQFSLKSLTLCLKHFIGEHSAENLKETIQNALDSYNKMGHILQLIVNRVIEQ